MEQRRLRLGDILDDYCPRERRITNHAVVAMIDDEEQGRLDDLARDPTALVVYVVDETSARRLQQLVRGGEPEVRLLAVRALGRTGNLDYVPSLIYALTDPDRRIVLEARDGLQFVSRRFDGFGPPNDFNEDQRYEAIDAWKRAVELDAGQFNALYNLWLELARAGRREEAVRYGRQFVETAPRAFFARDIDEVALYLKGGR